MDEEQQIIQEPVQEPAPEKQSDKTQAILTAFLRWCLSFSEAPPA